MECRLRIFLNHGILIYMESQLRGSGANGHATLVSTTGTLQNTKPFKNRI